MPLEPNKIGAAEPLAPLNRRLPSIICDSDFSDWSDVDPEYRDAFRDTTHRHEQGWGRAGIYHNTTGRNDFVTCKVARDTANVYFYAQTRHDISSYRDTNWMLLFINSDQDHNTGWEGYDYLVNLDVIDPNTTTLKAKTSGWNWTTVNSNISYRVSGNRMELSIPRADIQQDSGDHVVALDFHWADNMQKVNDIIEFSISGDSAPDRRFDYRYVTRH